MSKLREAAQQALEALEEVDGPITALLGSLLGSPAEDAPGTKVRASITALRAALAESERDWSMLEATQESLREHMAEIHRLRAALAQQPEPAQEPVAWMVEGSLYASKEVAQKMGGNAYTLQALYTAPPQRPPLTDEEMRKLWSQYGYKSALCMRFARAVERKVRGEEE